MSQLEIWLTSLADVVGETFQTVINFAVWLAGITDQDITIFTVATLIIVIAGLAFVDFARDTFLVE